MSFGFSAGDIYDGVVLIKNVVQALDSKTLVHRLADWLLC